MTTHDEINELLADEESDQFIAARALTLKCWDSTGKVDMGDLLSDV